VESGDVLGTIEGVDVGEYGVAGLGLGVVVLQGEFLIMVLILF